VARSSAKRCATGGSLTDKAALRAELALHREAAARSQPDAGERLAAAFPEDLMPSPGAVVAGYVRFRSEIDPLPLLRRLADHGCALALPRTPAKPGSMGAGAGLSFHRWAPGEPLIRGAFGVLEPAAAAAEVTPDLVLVPLLGFDRALHRLGYGAGHYDRTLAALSGVTAIGLAFAAQEVDALPAEPHDVALAAVVTPDGVRRRA
jgi:5-formyltetrahydrofolate cyclo-ligase